MGLLSFLRNRGHGVKNVHDKLQRRAMGSEMTSSTFFASEELLPESSHHSHHSHHSAFGNRRRRSRSKVRRSVEFAKECEGKDADHAVFDHSFADDTDADLVELSNHHVPNARGLAVTQHATIQALDRINQSMNMLIKAQTKDVKVGDENNAIDRTVVRLDGMEVYAVVSALIISTSIACFDNYDCPDLTELIRHYQYVDAVGALLYLASSSFGILAGVHSTLVFSLMTMYGKTAVGIDRDDAYKIFFKNTAPQRSRGFNSFRASLYCFMIQMAVLFARTFPLGSRIPIFTISIGIVMWIVEESQSIIRNAGIIYSLPNQKVHEDRRKGLKSHRFLSNYKHLWDSTANLSSWPNNNSAATTATGRGDGNSNGNRNFMSRSCRRGFGLSTTPE